MRKIISILAFLTIIQSSFADEGMWLLTMLESLKIQSKGLNLSDEDIYSINKSSMKDAIIGLGMEGRPFRFFCTAELVSDEGLLFTNHHCGLDLIQNHSTIGNNLLKDGFWAQTKAEELPNEGITASYVVMMKDVSKTILSAIPDTVSLSTREKIIDSLSTIMIASVEDTSHYVASVKPFYEGNRFYMFIYETFKDVRLVGNPPTSIGNFGADTDNWMWPRHTGDFCILRIYTDKDGKPAEYSEDNIPFRPSYHLPISLKGYEKDDYAMIMGFPGSTERYETSYGVKETLEIRNKEAIDIRSMKLDIIRKFMKEDPAIKIQYATKWQHTSNYWKYFIGQNKGIANLDVIQQKKDLERDLTEWIHSDQNLRAKYGKVLNQLAELYVKIADTARVIQYYREGMFNTSDLIFIPYEFLTIRKLISDEAGISEIENERNSIHTALDKFYEEFNFNLEKELLLNILSMYMNNIDEQYHPELFSVIKKKYKGNVKTYLDKTLQKSLFTDSTNVYALFESSNIKKLHKDLKKFEKDPLFKMMRDVINTYHKINEGFSDDIEEIDSLRTIFMEALLANNGEVAMYPDANSTLRLTFGYIGDYKPRDAVVYRYYTTLEGVIEKEDPNNDEFIVDPKLKELFYKKDYGRYEQNGTINTCFTSNNDITGGNSGSPVINADGELIGIAFDGNWEAMSGDIIFEDKIQKTINVDIRYVLFIIDKFAGATHIINELTIHE